MCIRDRLSKRNISKVSIVPNINTKFSQSQKVSLFKVLPENTVVWIKDLSMLLDRLQLCFEKAEEFAKTVSVLDETELAEIFRDRAFILPKDVTSDIEKYPMLFLNKNLKFEVDTKIEFNSKPQPNFNKNFKLLIEDLHGNTKKGLENYIFTDNPKQIERFYAIFEDLDANVQFHPVNSAISSGFLDLDLKIACYTDHQIFHRFHKYKLKRGFTKDQAINLKMLRSLEPGDFVTHIDHGLSLIHI